MVISWISWRFDCSAIGAVVLGRMESNHRTSRRDKVIGVRFSRELLARVDQHAQDLARERGTPVQRGTAIRELVHAALRERALLEAA